MRARPAAVLALAAVAVAGGIAACGTGRRLDPPMALVAEREPQVAHGQRVFMRACHQCHPRGETGLGPALNNKYVPAFLIRTQTRLGLGAMPAFPEAVLSDGDLDAVVRYIQFMQYEAASPPG